MYPTMRRNALVLLGGLIFFGLLPGQTDAKPTPPTTYWRCYSTSDIPALFRPAVAAIEKERSVAAPPAPITEPTWKVAPKTFNITVRRGKEEVWIAVLILVNTAGTPLYTYVLGASDKAVADQAGHAIARARYHPAMMNGKAVPAAVYFWSVGAGMPR